MSEKDELLEYEEQLEDEIEQMTQHFEMRLAQKQALLAHVRNRIWLLSLNVALGFDWGGFYAESFAEAAAAMARIANSMTGGDK